MKTLKYFFACMLALAAFSCNEDPILKNVDDDDPIVIPPPKPSATAPAPLDSL